MKIRVLLFTLFLGAYGAMAQCTPDVSYTAPGIYPPLGSTVGIDSLIQLPDAPIGSFYEEIIQVKVPSDTTIDFAGTVVTANVDSFRLDGILNLPPGLSYDCNNPTCAWPGSQNGCVRIFGTPTGSLSNYNLGVQIRAFLRVFSLPIDSLQSLNSYSIEVVPAVSLVENNKPTLKLYPNPTSGPLTIELANVAHERVQWTLIDLSGRTVQSGAFDHVAGVPHPLKLNRPSNGLYLIQFTTSRGSLTRRVSLHE